MEIEYKITVGNIITLVSVLISVLALLYAWMKDRKLKRKEKADSIRTAAAKTLKGIERWKGITSSIFYKCDPCFVEASEMLTKKEKFDFNELEKPRDFLWKKLMSILASNKDLILKEDLRNAYFDLFPYAPQIKELYEFTIIDLQFAESSLVDDFIADSTQNEILHINDYIENKYHSALLGNRLRYARNDCLNRFETDIEKASVAIRNQLIHLINQTDEELTRYNTVYRALKHHTH